MDTLGELGNGAKERGQGRKKEQKKDDRTTIMIVVPHRAFLPPSHRKKSQVGYRSKIHGCVPPACSDTRD